MTADEASKLTECFIALEKEVTKIASFYDVRLVLAGVMEMASRLAAASVKHDIYTDDQIVELFLGSLKITFGARVWREVPARARRRHH